LSADLPNFLAVAVGHLFNNYYVFSSPQTSLVPMPILSGGSETVRAVICRGSKIDQSALGSPTTGLGTGNRLGALVYTRTYIYRTRPRSGPEISGRRQLDPQVPFKKTIVGPGGSGAICAVTVLDANQ